MHGPKEQEARTALSTGAPHRPQITLCAHTNKAATTISYDALDHIYTAHLHTSYLHLHGRAKRERP